ncbi:hypothetical protein ACHAXT_009792 [Thalassiosira profunda]
MISRASLSLAMRARPTGACARCRRPGTAMAPACHPLLQSQNNMMSTPHCRQLSTRIDPQREGGGSEKEAMSNRAAFKNTPIIPSILAHIEKIGVGIRSKPKRRRRPRNADGEGGASSRGRSRRGDTLDESEELEYFAESDRRHRVQRQSKRGAEDRGRRPGGGSKKGNRDDDKAPPGRTGLHWLPPPPFSSFSRAEERDELGRHIVRRPVKLIGKAGTLNDKLPRESKGLAEVAIAGRSNVGKSTLLNALLYGNIDETLAPREYRRGRTPEGAKLPRGVKAITSDRPGETRELSFYQLSADVAEEGQKEKAKMSLLMVDLPGYGFAYAKDERRTEWRDLMHHYLLERRSLKRILLLLDARHGFKKADFDFLGEMQDGLLAKMDDDNRKTAKRELPPIQLVLTKCDLVKQPDLARRVVVVREQLSDFLIREPSSLPVMLVSARAGLGFNNVRGETPLGGVLELQRELASLVPAPRAHERRK